MTEIGDSFFLQLLVSFPLRSRPLRVTRGPVCPPLLGTLDRSSSDGLAGCDLLFVLFFFFSPFSFSLHSSVTLVFVRIGGLSFLPRHPQRPIRFACSLLTIRCLSSPFLGWNLHPSLYNSWTALALYYQIRRESFVFRRCRISFP